MLHEEYSGARGKVQAPEERGFRPLKCGRQSFQTAECPGKAGLGGSHRPRRRPEEQSGESLPPAGQAPGPVPRPLPAAGLEAFESPHLSLGLG